jgi:Flp pilus assembly protein TadD
MMRLTSVALAVMLAMSSTALAAGGGGGSEESSPATKKCKTGQVWDKNTKKCVKAKSGVLPDEELYEQGRALAKAGQYGWAIEVLAHIQNKRDPRVLNYLGYSYRKSGRLDLGISYYRRALAIDPDFNLAREYLGEGYIAAGRKDLAMLELAAIEKSCGKGCEEYKDLAAALSEAN